MPALSKTARGPALGLLAAALGALPVWAQGVAQPTPGPWELQLCRDQARLDNMVVIPPAGWLRVEAPDQELWGARLGWDLLRQGANRLQASGGLTFGTRSPLGYRNSAGAGGTVGAEFRLQQQWLAGLTGFHTFGRFEPGFGLDVRRESIIAQAPPGLRSGAVLHRLWWRALAQCHFGPTSWGRPYAALDMAAPFQHPRPGGLAYLADLDHLGAGDNPAAGTVARAHAPGFQFGVAFGLRFGAAQAAPPPTAAGGGK